jgi:hypothetical protein
MYYVICFIYSYVIERFRMSKYTHGLTTAEHNNIDGIDIYNARVYDALGAHLDKDELMIVDAFSGGPRDIFKMMKITNGRGAFAAIDSDCGRIKDLLEKNYDISKLGQIDFDVPEFRLVEGDGPCELRNGLVDAFNNSSVAIIQHSFPSAAAGSQLPDNLKADFMLCNAGIMFVPKHSQPPPLCS